MHALLQAFQEWRLRRKRFAEEWRLHLDLAAHEYERLGLTRSRARKHARKRLGSRCRYRATAMREIEADFAALLKLLPIARLCESAFVIPVAVLLGTILALIVNPARIQVVHSIVVGLFAPGASGLSARLVPLNRFGLIPTGFPSISWECGFLIGSAWLTIRWLRAQVSGRMLIWGVATLGVLGTAALVLWTTVIQLWAVAEWPLNFLQGLFVLGFLFGYAWLVVSVLRFWHRSVCRRCPICLHRLRMPLAQGALHNLLLDPYEVASVCIHGHGTLSESRWRRAFNPPAGFWRELFVERGGS